MADDGACRRRYCARTHKWIIMSIGRRTQCVLCLARNTADGYHRPYGDNAPCGYSPLCGLQLGHEGRCISNNELAEALLR